MKHRGILRGVAVALILGGTVGTILEIVPQIEALLLALAGRGYPYLALGIVGGLLLTFTRRKGPEKGSASPLPQTPS